MSVFYKKAKKLLKKPGFFLRDYFLNRYPLYQNEFLCPLQEEQIVIEHDLSLEQQLQCELPIDVVYTWVDHNDHRWSAKYRKYKNGDNYGENATDLARFYNNNELFYSIKSIFKFIPWVRNIYIITDGQIPEWIDLFSKVIIVDHRDIIPSEFLPTFNSHVIEAYIHKINNLSEYFLYFNDDVFVAREIPKSHFFKGNGVSSLFITKKSLNLMRDRGVNTPTLHACLNARELLFNDYNVEIDIPLVHSYIPLRKSMYDKAFEKYKEKILSFSKNKFRTNNDLNLATFLVPWYTYLHGCSVPYKDICYYFNLRSPVSIHIYKQLINSKGMPHSICANDVSQKDNSDVQHQNELLNNMLSIVFGDKNEYKKTK